MVLLFLIICGSAAVLVVTAWFDSNFQVPLHNATAIIVDNSGGLENKVSLSMNRPPADKGISNV